MARETDVFYAFCTFWTGDWAWLRRMNGHDAPRPPRGEYQRLADGSLGRVVSPSRIPQCPFCGAVGFEADRETWLRQAREWEDGTSPKALGVAHPGYVDMLLWSEKKCFPDYAALERAWHAETGR